MMGVGRRSLWRVLVAVVLTTSLAGSLSGCLDIPKAAQVIVEVHDDGITLVKPTGGALDASGETVITIKNFTDTKRQIVLADTDLPASELPDSLVDAVSPRDDDRIVSMTSQMEKAKVVVLLTVPQPNPTVEKMHVYLEGGQDYLLFDRLGGYENGIALEMRPPQG